MILLLFGSLGETSSSGPFQSWIPQHPWQETTLVIPQFFAKIYLLRKKKKKGGAALMIACEFSVCLETADTEQDTIFVFSLDRL